MLILAGGVVGATLILACVLSIGRWAYDYRRCSLHRARLERVLAQHPTEEQIAAALDGEGARVLAAAATAADVQSATRRWAPGSVQAETRSRGAARLRVFQAADMTYLLFFDADGRMTGYALVGC
jgi:hypothetical protein